MAVDEAMQRAQRTWANLEDLARTAPDKLPEAIARLTRDELRLMVFERVTTVRPGRFARTRPTG